VKDSNAQPTTTMVTAQVFLSTGRPMPAFPLSRRAGNPAFKTAPNANLTVVVWSLVISLLALGLSTASLVKTLLNVGIL
jgi:hypothetical protein